MNSLQLHDRVFSVLYKLGRVIKIEDGVITVQWDRAGFGQNYYYASGLPYCQINSYPTIQKVADKETFTEAEIEQFSNWQTKQMDLFFKITIKGKSGI